MGHYLLARNLRFEYLFGPREINGEQSTRGNFKRRREQVRNTDPTFGGPI
jgi:hypothetical protein